MCNCHAEYFSGILMKNVHSGTIANIDDGYSEDEEIYAAINMRTNSQTLNKGCLTLKENELLYRRILLH